MQAISPSKGIYLFHTITFEIVNGKSFPIGTGYYKTERSPVYRNYEIKVRLHSLYNPSSIGPKEKIQAVDLPRYLVHIQNLEVLSNPNPPFTDLYKVTWNIIVDENHQAIIDEHSAINAEFILQEQEEREFEDGFLIDEYNLSLQEKEVADGLFFDDQCKHESDSQDCVIYPDNPEEY